jgi:hypothetical protein
LLDIAGAQAVSVAARGERASQVASGLLSLREMWRSLLALAVLSALIGGAARAQNLDQGKSAPKLFVDGCATCHRTARGLAKGRFSLTLFMFLRDHYATNTTSAWALTSYLESVDSAPRGRARAAAAKPSAPAHHSAESSPRPPTPVPQR